LNLSFTAWVSLLTISSYNLAQHVM
jgi:hypothetical protein